MMIFICVVYYTAACNRSYSAQRHPGHQDGVGLSRIDLFDVDISTEAGGCGEDVFIESGTVGFVGAEKCVS